MIVQINTHPIVTETREEYFIDWHNSFVNVKPIIEDGKPVFYIMSGQGNIRVNTIDIKEIENLAKKLTNPTGREAVTTDKAYIYILEESGERTLMGVVTHNHIKKYQQMYDSFEYY